MGWGKYRKKRLSTKCLQNVSIAHVSPDVYAQFKILFCGRIWLEGKDEEVAVTYKLIF